MGQPRRLLAGQTHSITRRVSGRRFLLKPTSFVNEVVLYSLGYAKSQYPDFRLHGFVAEANHHHASCTDGREAKREEDTPSPIPGFYHRFHRMVAAALNTHYGRGENFWRDGSYDNVEVHSQTSIEQQLLYLWTNPVRDGLVERPEAWPGVIFLPEDFGRTFRVERPDGAFFGGRAPRKLLDNASTVDDDDALIASNDSDNDEIASEHWQVQLAREEAEAWALLESQAKAAGRWPRSRSRLPEVVEFTIDPPEGYEHMPIEEVRRHFRLLLDAELERIHVGRRATGRGRFMGSTAILSLNPRASAKGTWPTFACNPRVACRGSTSQRLAVLQGLVEWRQAYRLAYEALVRGVQAPFPAGTYGLARFPRVRVRRRATGPPLRTA